MGYPKAFLVAAVVVVGCGPGDDSGDAISDAVYVSPDGDDAAVGTRDSPKATLEAAMEVAAEALVGVRVAGGSYDIGSLVVPVSIEGGYDPDTWEHTPETSTTTLTTADAVAMDVAPASGITALTLAHFTVEGASARIHLSTDAALAYTLHDLELTGSDSSVVFNSGTAEVTSTIERVGVQTLNVSGTATVTEVTVRGETRAFGVDLTLRDSTVALLYLSGAADNDVCEAHVEAIQATGLWIVGGDARCAVEFLRSSIDGATMISVYDADVTIASSTVDLDLTDALVSQGFGVSTGAVLTLVGSTVRVSAGREFVTGMRVESGSEARLAHNVFEVSSGENATLLSLFNGEAVAVNNAFGVSGGGTLQAVDMYTGGSATLTHNAFTAFGCYTGTACAFADFQACAWTGCTSAVGNLEVPDPGYADASAGDFHISPSSALHDAGADPVAGGFASTLVATDIDGEARPQGLGWDIGIDEVDE